MKQQLRLALVGVQPSRDRPVRVLAYGGGLDSFALLRLAIERGEALDAVVFCDVGDGTLACDGADPGEWPGTYRHLREVVVPMCRQQGIRFEWIDTGRYPIRGERSLWAYLWRRRQIPVAGPSRFCTFAAKTERFEAWLRAEYAGDPVEVWVGFDAGEVHRASRDPNSGAGYALRKNRYPLIELGLCRCRVLDYLMASGYPVPPGSACLFCPYNTRGEWQRLATEQAGVFDQVVQLEARKPPTARGLKLSIAGFRILGEQDGRVLYRAPPLNEYVRGTYRPRNRICDVCGRPRQPKGVRTEWLAGDQRGGDPCPSELQSDSTLAMQAAAVST